VHGFCASRKGATGGGGWGHPQDDMHMVAARLGCERFMVGTEWARLTQHYSHLVEGWFLARKAALALSGCMTTDSADYCMLVNDWALLRWTWFSFGVTVWIEIGIWCIRGMFMLKVVSSGKNLGFKDIAIRGTPTFCWPSWGELFRFNRVTYQLTDQPD